jgi:hypothetical protein
MHGTWMESRLSWERRRTVHARARVWLALVLSMTAASTISCKGPLHVGFGRDAAVTQDLQSESRDTLLAVDLAAEPDSRQVAVGRDAAVTQDLRPQSRDTLVAADLATEPDSRQATDGAPPVRCTNQTAVASEVPVLGSIRGPKLDGVVCDNGLETVFLGPQGSAVSSYAQSFDTIYDSNDSYAHAFLFDMPADVSSASLSGFTGTTSPEVGTYASATNCGWLRFQVSLPIPPGVICPTVYGPCGPDCEGEGEMGICVPAHTTLFYIALPAAQCGPYQDPPKGDWQLTLTSVSPYVVPGTLINYLTHGHLTAMLVNEADPSDSIVLNFDF